MHVARRNDGIGRRAGLKIQSWRQGAGSTPASGTKKTITHSGDSFFATVSSVSQTRLSLARKREIGSDPRACVPISAILLP